jgi:hypothetical protein
MHLSIITDEIGQDLDHVLAVCHDMQLSTIELRDIEGQNIIFYSDEQLKTIAARIHDSGFSVCAIDSPFLKCHYWGMKEQTKPHQGDFGSTEIDTYE